MSETSATRSQPTGQLKRVVGVPGAVFMGLGSIMGTGIFVSIGIAAGIAGDAVMVSILVAAVVAACNGLSSAQLAACHPVSGGTYEYGYRFLNPALGFTAGWMFLCAKSASAATAALGFAGYALDAASVSTTSARVITALLAIVLLTAVVAGGVSRSNRVNTAIVLVTLLALGAFVVTGFPIAADGTAARFDSIVDELGTGDGFVALLHGSALMFVAYTGYGRIATLGEEVRDPRRSIPRAMIVTLASTALLYGLVAFVAVGAAGASMLASATEERAAPLEAIARTFALPGVSWIVTIGAVTAMLGVLLNLLLGLSRVVLAMSRRRDLPARFAAVDAGSGSPKAAVWLVGLFIAALAALGSVRLTWSFSAFTVLVYYALTNIAALRLPLEARLYPRWISVLGLVGCAGLAFWVEPAVWMVGLAVIGAGLAWHVGLGGGRKRS